MNLYKVESDSHGFLITAVVACESEDQAVKVAGFDDEWIAEHNVYFIGKGFHTEAECICVERP